MREGLLVVVLLGSFLLGPPTAAHAQAREEDPVEALLLEGIADRRAGRLHSAASVFERAYEVEPSPRVAVQLGLTLAQLERWVEAEGYLLEAVDQPDDAFVRRRREAIDRALGVIREHLGSIEIRGGEPGARVLVDGTDRGTLPLAPIRVVLGGHRVEVLSSAGPVRREIRVEEGQRSRVLELPVPTAPASGEDELPGPEGAERGDDSRTYFVAGFATLGFAGGALVLGVTSSLIIRNLGSDRALLEARGMTLSTDDSVCDNEPLAPRVRTICDRYPKLRALQATGYVAAGLGAAITAVLWVLAADEGSASGEEDQARGTSPPFRLALDVDRRAGSLRLSAQF